MAGMARVVPMASKIQRSCRLLNVWTCSCAQAPSSRFKGNLSVSVRTLLRSQAKFTGSGHVWETVPNGSTGRGLVRQFFFSLESRVS